MLVSFLRARKLFEVEHLCLPLQPTDTTHIKDWQEGLRALLPNINISFGAGQQQQQQQQQTTTLQTQQQQMQRLQHNHLQNQTQKGKSVGHSFNFFFSAACMNLAVPPGPLLCSSLRLCPLLLWVGFTFIQYSGGSCGAVLQVGCRGALQTWAGILL